VYINVN